MHAVIAFSAQPLCLGALFSDWAHASSRQGQWTDVRAADLSGTVWRLTPAAPTAR